MPKQKTQKIILLDANALVHRGFHALPPLTTKDGQLINAVFGFTSILLKVLAEEKPTHVAAAFDFPAPTFRHKEYKKYKATREKAPDELRQQFPIVKKVLRAMNIPIYESKGFEADDVIGALAKKVEDYSAKHPAEKLHTLIVTGDLDALQLIDSQTSAFTLRRGIQDTITYDPAGVEDRFGLTPDQLTDYKGLRGDTSDNIPGVPGIGEKTATDLLKAFGSLEEIYAAIDKAAREVAKQNKVALGKLTSDDLKDLEIRPTRKPVTKPAAARKPAPRKAARPFILKGRALKALWDNRNLAILSKHLGTITPKVPIKFSLKDLSLHDFDRKKVVTLFQELQFKNLLARIPKTETAKAQPSLFEAKKSAAPEKLKFPKGYKIISTPRQLDALITKLKKAGTFALDIETNKLGPVGCQLAGLSFSTKEGEAQYLPVGHTQADSKKDPVNQPGQVACSLALKKLKPLLESPRTKKVGHNIKYDLAVLLQHGIDLHGIAFDTMIASYILDPGNRAHSLDNLAFTEFGHEMIPIKQLIGTGRKEIMFAHVPVDQAAVYSCEDADYTFRLWKTLDQKLTEASKQARKDPTFIKKSKTNDPRFVFEKIEMPLIPILARMEVNGTKIDEPALASLSKKFASQIQTLEKKIYKLAGKKFTINSPQQLSEILFVKLKLPTTEIKKIKTGYSTAAAELEKLKGKHPIIKLISDYRELAKLKSTYVDALPKLLDSDTNRLHTSFNQTVTATGRLSSSDPNLQNIPIRTPQGREIRAAFIADRGYSLLSLDYSQIELRVVASIAADKKMIASFRKNEDIHARTAAEVFEVPLAKVDRDMRRMAKTVNFGVVYGMSPFGLAQTLGIEREKAKDFIDKYFQKYQGVQTYIKNVIAFAKENEFVETLLGRRRYVPEINSSVYPVRAAAERVVINMPVQGTAADIIKLAMIDIARDLPEAVPMNSPNPGADYKLLLQVHDELLFEVKTVLARPFARKIKKIMESAYNLIVPIIVDAKLGQNWENMKVLRI